MAEPRSSRANSAAARLKLPAIPADLRDITVPQHDLAIYDAVGGMA